MCVFNALTLIGKKAVEGRSACFCNMDMTVENGCVHIMWNITAMTILMVHI